MLGPVWSKRATGQVLMRLFLPAGAARLVFFGGFAARDRALFTNNGPSVMKKRAGGSVTALRRWQLWREGFTFWRCRASTSNAGGGHPAYPRGAGFFFNR